MNIIRRNKMLTGNIALLVFIMFLFTLTFSSTGAFANTIDVEASFNPNTAQAVKELSSLNNSVDVYVKLEPVTAAQFSSIFFEIIQSNVVKDTVYVTDTTYQAAYHSVYDSVYRYIYGLAYAFVPSSIDLGYGQFTLAFYGVPEVLQSVYLELEAPPPPAADPQPSSPTPVAADPVEEDSNVEIVVDSEQDKAVVTVVSEKAVQAIEDTGRVTIRVSEQVVASQREIALPNLVVRTAQEKSAVIEVVLPEVSIEIPAAALNVAEITGASENASVNLNVGVVRGEAAQAVEASIPPAARASMTRAAQVYQFNMEVVEEGQAPVRVTRFAQPLKVDIPFEIIPGTNPTKMGVYRLADDGTSWNYVGGKVNIFRGAVQANLNSFSYYTVLEFNKVFADTVGHWAQIDVEQMASRHIARGVGDDRFDPNNQITRAEFAALLVRSLGIPEITSAPASFADVTSDRWYYGVVEAAVDAGLVNGYDGNSFNPNNNITRQEMAVMIVRALDYAGFGSAMTSAAVDQILAQFSDAGQISQWARESAAFAAKESIVRGRNGELFAPGANATRAEAIVMLKRMLVTQGEI